MPGANAKLTAAVEAYFEDLRRIRASGGGTSELSYYPALTTLFDAVGGTLRPRVFCVSQLAQQGAGHPDFGLYTTRQVQRGQPKQGQTPERGVVEVKPAGDDAWLTTEGPQVSRYWEHYRLVLVTNTRDFVLLGEDTLGHPAKLETFRLAVSLADFEAKLQHPRAFAREVGAALGEYLSRTVRPCLIPETWRGCWRPTPGTDWPGSRPPARPHPWEPYGLHWRRPWAPASRENGGQPSSAPLWCRPCSTEYSPPGCCGRGRRPRPLAGSTGTNRSGTCGPRYCGRYSSSFPTRAGCNPWDWWRCWTGLPRRWTG